MIQDFEIETAPLSNDELFAASFISVIIKKHVGKENTIVSSQIAEECKKQGVNIPLPGARIRKIINYLRHHQLPNIAATSQGYYLPKDRYEMEDYLKSLKDRRDAIDSVYQQIHKYYMSKIGSSQQKLSV